jgi:Dual specificity phosphatase, catalytic domain
MTVRINYNFQPSSYSAQPSSAPCTTTIKNLSIIDKAKSIYHRTINNPFFWTLALGTTTLAATAFSAIFLSGLTALYCALPSCALAGIAFLLATPQQRKWLFSELSLMKSTLAEYIPSWIHNHPWYAEITPQITLGAAPLKSRGHLEKIAQSHQAVLSLIEPFEHEPHFMGIPVQPADWSQAGLIFLNLPNPDLHAVKLEDVQSGVEWMHEQISRGKKVYVHCLAGVGRSATIVVCYLIKHCHYSPKDAIAYVKSKRRIAVNENSPAVAAFIASQRSSLPVN